MNVALSNQFEIFVLLISLIALFVFDKLPSVPQISISRDPNVHCIIPESARPFDRLERDTVFELTASCK